MIEVGNLVRRSPNSDYSSGKSTNPKGVVGIVVKYRQIEGWPVGVRWPGGFNYHKQKDLIKIT